MHLTLGILRTSQAFFYALAFFWLGGNAVIILLALEVKQGKASHETKTDFTTNACK